MFENLNRFFVTPSMVPRQFLLNPSASPSTGDQWISNRLLQPHTDVSATRLPYFPSNKQVHAVQPERRVVTNLYLEEEDEDDPLVPGMADLVSLVCDLDQPRIRPTAGIGAHPRVGEVDAFSSLKIKWTIP